MRSRLSVFGVAVTLALVAAACATDVVALQSEANSVAQGSLVAILDSESPTPDCAPAHRHVNKAYAPGDPTEFSLDAFVSALPPPKRYAFVKALWDAYQGSEDSRVSALLRRTLGYLLRAELCQVSS